MKRIDVKSKMMPRLQRRRKAVPEVGDAGHLAQPLIEAIYGAAIDEAEWPGMAAKIANAFGKPSASISLLLSEQSPLRPISLTANWELPHLKAYSECYWQQDILIDPTLIASVQNPLFRSAVISDEDFTRTEIYQDWFRKLGIFHVMSASIPIADGTRALLGVQSSSAYGPFDEPDKQLLCRIAPHLQRALQVRHRLIGDDLDKIASRAALEHLNCAMVIVESDARIMYATKRAEAIFRECDSIKIVRQRVSTRDQKTAQRLKALVDGAICTAGGKGSASGGMLTVERASKSPLTLLIAPLVGGETPKAAIFINEPDALVGAEIALSGMFGLSPTEAAVTSSLIKGHSVESICLDHHVSINTLRTQLKSIYLKTGTKRQAQLVSLVLRSIGPLGHRQGT